MKTDISNRAAKQLRKISSRIDRKNIKDRIKEIESTPNTKELRAEKLKGSQDRFKIRCGNYRIIFKKISSEEIFITAIADRKDIYNKLFGVTF